MKRTGAKLAKIFKGKIHERQLKTFGLFNLKKKSLRGDLIEVNTFLRRALKGEVLISLR